MRAAGLTAARAAMGARTARRRRVLPSAAPLGAHATAGAGGGCCQRAERRPGARLADGRGGRGPRGRGASCMAQSTLRPTIPPHAEEGWAAVGLGCGTRGGPVGAGGGMEAQPRPCCCAPAAGAGGPPRLASGGGAAPPVGGQPRLAVAAGPWFSGDVPSDGRRPDSETPLRERPPIRGRAPYCLRRRRAWQDRERRYRRGRSRRRRRRRGFARSRVSKRQPPPRRRTFQGRRKQTIRRPRPGR